jgi:rhodanese-related sulfurtransferase
MAAEQVFFTIDPRELAERWPEETDLQVIDVREELEWEFARIEGATLMPMSRLSDWIGSLDRERETVVICHHGMRSAHVCTLLVREGFSRVNNLAGGIDRWSYEVDPAVRRY